MEQEAGLRATHVSDVPLTQERLAQARGTYWFLWLRDVSENLSVAEAFVLALASE